MDRLLKRQIKRHLGDLFNQDPSYQREEFIGLLEAIQKSYEFSQNECHMMERMIDLNSKELNQANALLKQQNKEISKLATTDTLTGLPNRLVCHDRINQSLKRVKRYGGIFALLFLDLDRFKIINDTLGHHVGDLLLEEVAQRLLKNVRQSDTVSRLGGDEFTLLLDGVTDVNTPRIVAKKVIKALSQSFWIENHEFNITASIGIGIYPEGGEDLVEIVRNSDTAMYHAKAAGRNNFKVYHPEMHDQVVEYMELESSLRKALERDELTIHYQPQIDISTGKIVGVEALLRWLRPNYGMVSPAQFIPLAEETGLILPIGEWVFLHACQQNAEWQKKGLRPIKMGVNLSGVQLDRKDFINWVDKALSETGLLPEHLDLEITESMIMNTEGPAMQNILKLKKRGISLSIDDFGTGYSSLGNIKKFPIDTLKIDQSFVRDIVDDPAIVTAIIAMAKSLKLKVIAEGVELPEQFTFLKKKGCEYIQGYLASRPLEADSLETLLRQDPDYRVKNIPGIESAF